MEKEKLLHDTIRPVSWQNNCVHLLDQRALPKREVYLDISSTQDLSLAIKDMCVRGAPAIGIAAAFGAVLAAKEALKEGSSQFHLAFEKKLTFLASARPTAINLGNALQAAKALINTAGPSDPVASLLVWANNWLADDIAANHKIGLLGAKLINQPSSILTHCNAGALATGGYGTALGVIRACSENDLIKQLYAGETRPWNQGVRLTAWELNKEGIPLTVIADSAAALLMQRGLIDWVVVGADSITRDGDVINKIGTYSLAVLAKQHGVKLMVAAPMTTFDLKTRSGKDVVIEERAAAELLPLDYLTDNNKVSVWNPVFDVTPASLVDVIVTEKGVLKSPDARKMADFIDK